ncbi:MAG: PA14 domain-containing protein [Akkermansiaceae bacterium]|nr:PA14 domain-containing protein [Akkermansiaceae bacterium]
MIYRSLFSLCALTASAFAQDGGQLFTQHCSACHGTDGKGATGGAFPPLAGSAWVAGDADRAIKIVLHGLHGPINVAGKTYNLAMPPQGAVIPDDHIAAILTFVRSSWENQASAVNADLVKSIRAATSDRNTPWTAEEILKLHPLPFEKTALSSLISRVYQGPWSAIPDFAPLKPISVEEEHDGIISLSDSPFKESFAMVWEGTFEAPSAGDYTFLLDADDAATVTINNKPCLKIGGTGPMNGTRARRGTMTLPAGTHPFRVEYLQIKGNQGIALGWKAPASNSWKWLTDKTAPPREPIPIEAADGRPAIYRNFIAGSTARAIGFGFPGGFNISYSADNLATELVWTGKFMDGALHWVERGNGKEPPAGENVVNLSKSRALPAAAKFRGYKLDPTGNPTFSVQVGSQTLLDSWQANAVGLTRKLSISGSGKAMKILISDRLATKATTGHEYALGDKLLVTTDGAALETTEGKTTLNLDPAKPVTLTYRWK